MGHGKFEQHMTPRTIRFAAGLFASALIIDNLVIPGGTLALNAIHPHNRGESPLLSLIAMGTGFVLIFPRLLLGAIAVVGIFKGRNWARALGLLFIGASLYAAFQSVRLALVIGGSSGALWWLFYQGLIPLLYFASALLLFSKSANAWFRGKPNDDSQLVVSKTQNAPSRVASKKSAGDEPGSPVMTVKISLLTYWAWP